MMIAASLAIAVVAMLYGLAAVGFYLGLRGVDDTDGRAHRGHVLEAAAWAIFWPFLVMFVLALLVWEGRGADADL